MNINTIYLLTGAAGFLGINICTQLIERGEHIRAFVLKGDPARKYLPAEVEVFEGDLCSAEDCEAFFNIPEGLSLIHIWWLVHRSTGGSLPSGIHTGQRHDTWRYRGRPQRSFRTARPAASAAGWHRDVYKRQVPLQAAMVSSVRPWPSLPMTTQTPPG